MPALGFQKKFVDLILSNKKQQTIRAERKDLRPHCKIGDTLKLYSGWRTKHVKLIKQVKVVNYQPIEIYENEFNIINKLDKNKIASMVDENPQRDLFEQILSTGECDVKLTYGNENLDVLAKADGFKNWDELIKYFKSTYGLPFTGFLIKWED